MQTLSSFFTSAIIIIIIVIIKAQRFCDLMAIRVFRQISGIRHSSSYDIKTDHLTDDWLSCDFTSHLTQNRLFQRSSPAIACLSHTGPERGGDFCFCSPRPDSGVSRIFGARTEAVPGQKQWSAPPTLLPFRRVLSSVWCQTSVFWSNTPWSLCRATNYLQFYDFPC